MRKLSETVELYFRSHYLRATFGNRHWRNGEDILTIATMMRHKKSNTTFRSYIGIDQADQRGAHADRPGTWPERLPLVQTSSIQ